MCVCGGGGLRGVSLLGFPPFGFFGGGVDDVGPIAGYSPLY